ncbi:MAG: ABC transporter substrate-binding protein [Deltaproteobacteria bacterium]|nr:ABC transporter substrate-binding protein [Deltaproteobacteria bacterium]MBW1737049.1 ABC transporter substrate-binding protein [Deltaproteobacteria bacterium]MBW1909720.1 ABC transporter substrate-binding protein [Deltaproteobacteria bacterium]MBW2033427.1 ABC transporter substrate-binding protein [Deltaproteobacteria bacterium]MBW2114467.1 ABC transporter substrate-binding protein [Deltaproteobacteria bacterium]
MMKKSLFGIVALASFMALFLTPAFAGDAYLVGFSVAVTGRGSGIYAPVKDAFDIYFKQVNARGGINGHPVKLIIKDNAAEPSKAAAHAKKFVTQDKVILFMNAALSSTYAPMVQVAKRYNVPLFFAGAVCPDAVYPPKADPNLYCSTAFGAKYDSRFAIPFIKNQAKGPLKLGLAAMNIPVSRGEIDFAEELAKGMGIEVAGKVAIPPPTPDYTPFATKLKSAGANWVYAWAPWGCEVKTFEALRKLGWKGKYLAYAHIQAEDDLARLKDDDFYVFGTNAFFADDTEMHKKIRAISVKEKTIYPYTQLTEGWIAAMVLEEILKKTPWPPTPEKVRTAMNQIKVDLEGLKGGPLVWTKGNHFRTVNYYRVYKWDSKKNGIVIVKDWSPLKVE